MTLSHYVTGQYWALNQCDLVTSRIPTGYSTSWIMSAI
jgi:hypothetical protein